MAALLLGGCSGEEAPTPEGLYLAATRTEFDATLGDDAPEYGDEELLAFGERSCDNLEDVEDGEALRNTIEASSVGASETETLQIAQATIVVTMAATHLCPDEGRRLGIIDDPPAA